VAGEADLELTRSSTHFFGAVLLGVAASAGAAADLLPLRQGIFVRAGAPCKGASNADTLSYWGGDNGLNTQQTDCRIMRLSLSGTTYTLERRCQDIRSGSAFTDRTAITIASPARFTLDRISYRYCGRRVQF
jgi:hypothetical protein